MIPFPEFQEQTKLIGSDKNDEVSSEDIKWEGAQGNRTLWNILYLDLDGGFIDTYSFVKVHSSVYLRFVHFTVYM